MARGAITGRATGSAMGAASVEPEAFSTGAVGVLIMAGARAVAGAEAIWGWGAAACVAIACLMVASWLA